MWDLAFDLVWPIDDMRDCGMQKIERFVEYRLKTSD